MLIRLLLGLSLVLGTASCSGSSCAALPGLQAERDQARVDYQAQAAGGRSAPEELLEQHDALHELERRTYELEQSCERG